MFCPVVISIWAAWIVPTPSSANVLGAARFTKADMSASRLSISSLRL
jgi:hypothetical protein